MDSEFSKVEQACRSYLLSEKPDDVCDQKWLRAIDVVLSEEYSEGIARLSVFTSLLKNDVAKFFKALDVIEYLGGDASQELRDEVELYHADSSEEGRAFIEEEWSRMGISNSFEALSLASLIDRFQ